MPRAETAKIARAQSAFGAAALRNVPDCGRAFVQLLDSISGDQLIMPLRCHQWSCSYCAAIRLVHAKSKARRGHPERHIILTLVHRENENLKERVDFIRAKMRLFVQRIRRVYGRFEYMAVLELQENGTPHIHMLTRGCYIPQRWLSAAWCNLTGAWHVHIKAITRTEHSVAELVKYLAKTARDIEKGAPGQPVITTSKGWLIDAPDKNPDYAERNWTACYVPFCISDYQEVLSYLGRRLVASDGSPGIFQLNDRSPPSQARVAAAYELCPCYYEDLLHYALSMIASTHAAGSEVLARQNAAALRSARAEM